MREGCRLSFRSQVARQFTRRGRNLPKPYKYSVRKRGVTLQVRKMERIALCLAVCLLCMGGTSAQQANNVTEASANGTVAFSGSASGSGSADCSSAGCSHNCTDTTMGPMCMCPSGMQLSDDLQNCEVCPGGRWGSECSRNCSCGQGNPCHAATGMCMCNPCWSGTTCRTPAGSTCFLEFLGNEQKTVELLNRQYGGYPIPLPPSNTVIDLVATNLMEVTANVLADVNLQIVDRNEVNQGPVAKLTWKVDYNVNRPEAERGLLTLENKVKIGTVRATLVIQTLTNIAEVTLNAGTSI